MSESKARQAHYPGDVRETEVPAGVTSDGRVMVAVEAEYDETTNMTTIRFMSERDLPAQPNVSWSEVLIQDQVARASMHQMWPAFFPQPGGSR